MAIAWFAHYLTLETQVTEHTLFSTTKQRYKMAYTLKSYFYNANWDRSQVVTCIQAASKNEDKRNGTVSYVAEGLPKKKNAN